MERRISVGIFRPKYVDHLQRWFRIFRSEETETDLSIWIPAEISGIFGKMASTHNCSYTKMTMPMKSLELHHPQPTENTKFLW